MKNLIVFAILAISSLSFYGQKIDDKDRLYHRDPYKNFVAYDSITWQFEEYIVKLFIGDKEGLDKITCEYKKELNEFLFKFKEGKDTVYCIPYTKTGTFLTLRQAESVTLTLSPGLDNYMERYFGMAITGKEIRYLVCHLIIKKQ